MENNVQNNSGGFGQFMPNNNQFFQAQDYRVGFGRRLGAWLLDFLIVGIVMGVVVSMSDIDFSIFAGMDFSNLASFEADIEKITMQIAVYSVIISMIYNSTEIFLAASPGKLILGIKIAEAQMHTADYQKLVVRFLIKNINTVFSMIFVISSIQLFSTLGSFAGFIIFVGCFFVLGEKRQAFHDMAAGTAVYYKNDLNSTNSGQV